jgi:hypothetical protein
MMEIEDLAEDEIAILNESEVDRKLSNFLRKQFGWNLTEDAE